MHWYQFPFYICETTSFTQQSSSMKTTFPILALFFIALSASNLNAQQGITYPETRVALAPLSYDRNTANENSAEKLYHYLFNALFNTKRFTVVDRLDGYKRIVIEKKLQEGSDFIDGKVVAQGKLQGASLMIFAHLNTAQASPVTDANGKTTSFSGDLSLFIRIVDVESGQVLASQIITPSGISAIGKEVDKQGATGFTKVLTTLFKGGCSGGTELAAIEACMSKIEVHIKQFVSDNFPLEMRIFTPYDGPGGKKEFWLIGAGDGHNLKVGQKLTVTRTQKIDVGGGKTMRRVDEVLKLKIIGLNGEFITTQAADKEERTKEVNLLAALKNDPNSIKVLEIK